jgi:alpha-glucosidase
MWWDNAVIYQVYVRSFQDTDGDGVGDLPGVTRRLDHIAGLGASAVWLSPIYPSPNADFGYDVTDFRDVEAALGTLGDLDRLIAEAHARDLKVLLDFVPCHTSTQHPWFRTHPEYYVWADEPANNWRAAFGGSSWGYDEQTGRYFLHSFFPEQADLDWRKPEVASQMTSAMRFWLERGVDGFRLDAIDRLLKDRELRDDPPARTTPVLPGDPEDLKLEHLHSRNAPDIPAILKTIRDAVGPALLVGEVYLPVAETVAYLESLDVVFNFEAIFAADDPKRLAAAIGAALEIGQQGWVASNHDFSRLVTRAGAESARASLMLLLSLPGPTFLYQGDELGYGDATMTGTPLDRHGRNGFRMPIVWDSDDPSGGFSSGAPWLVASGSAPPGVAQQDADPDSTLSLVKAVIAVRPELADDAEVLESAPGTIVVRRGRHVVAVNLSGRPQAAPVTVRIRLEARPGDGADPSAIPAHGGWIGTLLDTAEH